MFEKISEEQREKILQSVVKHFSFFPVEIDNVDKPDGIEISFNTFGSAYAKHLNEIIEENPEFLWVMYSASFDVHRYIIGIYHRNN
jgi:hypothetical protein